MPRKKKKAANISTSKALEILDNASCIARELSKVYYDKYNKHQNFDDGTLANGHQNVLLTGNNAAITVVRSSEFNGLLANYAYYAIEEHFTDIIKLILGKNLLKLDDNYPLLNMAISLKNNEILNLLIPHIDKYPLSSKMVYLSDHTTLVATAGFSAIHEAAKNGNIEALNILWQKDERMLDINTSKGFSAFHIALSSHNFPFAEAILDKNPSIINKAINKKLLRQPLHEATELFLAIHPHQDDNNSITANNKSIFDFLMTSGADVNITTKSGRTPLYLAVEFQKHEMIEELLSKSTATVNQATSSGQTPMSLAISSNDVKSIKLLIQHKADLTAKTPQENNILEYAIAGDHFEALECLLGYTQEKIRYAYFTHIFETQDGQLVDRLSEILDPETHRESFAEATLYSIVKNRTKKSIDKIIKFLSQNKLLSTILKSECNYGLDVAIEMKDNKLFHKLVEIGADPDRTYHTGDTPLSISIICKNAFAAKQLMTPHNINTANFEGLTPMHLAAFHGMNDVLELLIHRGASFNVKDTNGNTPLDYANFGGHQECINSLKPLFGLPVVEPKLVHQDNWLSEEFDDTSLIQSSYPTTQQEEDRSSQIGKLIHNINQQRKARLNKYEAQEQKISKQQEAIKKSWVLASGEKYSTFIPNTGKVFEVPGNNNMKYFAISRGLNFEPELCQKLVTAMSVGIVGRIGQQGIKILKKNIKGQQKECLYELKIYSSKYGDFRLFTSNKYVKNDGQELIIFETSGNHTKVKNAVKNSGGMKKIHANNINDLHELELQGDDIAVKSWFIPESEEKDAVECVGASNIAFPIGLE